MNLAAHLGQLAGDRLAVFAILAPVVACLLAAGASQLARHASAATRHLIWLLAFVAMAISLPVALLGWKLPVPVLPAPPSAAPRSIANSETRPSLSISGIGEVARPIVLAVPPPSASPEPFHLTKPLPAPTAPSTSPALPWKALAFGLWLTGVLVLTVARLVARRLLRHILTRAQDHLIPPTLTALWVELLSTHRARVAPRLLLSAEITVPLVTGLRRPTILLPESAAQWPAATLRAALLHELAHLTRGDLWTAAFARAITSLYWFHPAAWIALRALQAEAEMAADDAVILREAQPVAYAETLLTLVRTLRTPAPPSLPAIGMLRNSGIETRLARILDGQSNRAALSASRCRGAIAAVSLAVFAALVLHPVAAAPHTTAGDDTSTTTPATQPFATAPFQLGPSSPEFSPSAVAPALPFLSAQDRVRIGLPAVDPVTPMPAPVRLGIRPYLPVGPIRVVEGVFVLPRQFSPAILKPSHGDFPGPGYREQQQQPQRQKPVPAVSPATTGPTASAASPVATDATAIAQTTITIGTAKNPVANTASNTAVAVMAIAVPHPVAAKAAPDPATAFQGEPVTPELQKSIIDACLASLRGVASLRFSIQTETTYAGDYLLRNPDKVRFDHLRTQYEGLMEGERFRVTSQMTEPHGGRQPETIQAFDGHQYHLLRKDQHPWLMVRDSFRVDSDTTFQLGTGIFLPFTFLYLTSDDTFVPNLSLQRLADRAAWTTLFQKARITLRNELAGLLQIRFPLGEGGTYYLVTFSTDDGYYPISFEKYGPGGLAQRYLVEQFRITGESGRPEYRYPEKAKFETFLHGWQRNIITVDTTRVAVNDSAAHPAADFNLDTGLAESVFHEE